MDPAEISRLTTKLNGVLNAKNQEIRDMQYRVARSTKAYNDTLNTLEAKVRQVGIPSNEFEEMGFKPLISGTSVGPAGLVAK